MVGGTPVPVSFADTHQSLSLGVVDCAITGPSSANSAGWPEVTTHQMAIGFQMALNGYGMTMKSWNALTPDQQAKLKKAFDTLNDDVWKYSEELFQDALNCNAGKDPCTTGKKFNLVNVPVTPADIDAGAQRGDQGVAAGLGRGVRQVQPRLLEDSGRPRSHRCWG